MIVVEGDTDLPFARKLARDAGFDDATEIDAQGKGEIDKYLDRYNDAAKGSPWLVLRDLDHDAGCAPEFLDDISFAASAWMCFRLVVRELESWVLADARGLARFLDVDEQWIPKNPDAVKDPTATLVEIARRARRGDIRRKLVPAAGAYTQVGPLYEATLIEFGEKHWSLARAVQRSESLLRARAATRALGARWKARVTGCAAASPGPARGLRGPKKNKRKPGSRR